MRSFRVRLTVFRLLLLVAICAIVTFVITDGVHRRARERTDRCLVMADNHARIGHEYRKNARGDAERLRIAAWHDHMRQVFEEAAGRSGGPIPVSQAFPPPGWRGPEREAAGAGM